MSIKGKLNRLKNHITLEQPREQKKTTEVTETKKEEIPFLEKWLQFGAKPFYFDDSYCLVRTVTYPLDYQHGLYCFKELNDIVKMWNETSTEHPLSSRNHRSSDLFFFDTETTGLGGGVGNTIFLLGHARITEQEVVLTQHFLPNPGAEVALYQSFLSCVDYTTLVTYNGKSFDWPQLKTRHTLIRDAIPKLPEFGHFDLYHASRRLWKKRLESVRLTNVEKEILDIKRTNDVPGYLAPIIYFDYLQNKNPEGIFGVMVHNEADILSLISLYIHLSKTLLSTDTNQSEQYEVARWFDSLGQKRVAAEGYRLASLQNTDESISAKFALAIINKKNRNWSEAILNYKDVYRHGGTHYKIKAAIELSKLYEHKIKDIQTASDFAELAFNLWKGKQRLIKAKEVTERLEFEKRISRLKNKCGNVQ